MNENIRHLFSPCKDFCYTFQIRTWSAGRGAINYHRKERFSERRLSWVSVIFWCGVVDALGGDKEWSGSRSSDDKVLILNRGEDVKVTIRDSDSGPGGKAIDVELCGQRFNHVESKPYEPPAPLIRAAGSYV